MKILYGVTGEGMGHAMRSRVLVEHLVAEGHDVAIVASGKALPFLRTCHGEVRPIHGLHMIFDGNRVDADHALVQLAQNAIQYGASARAVGKKLEILRAVADS